MEAKRLPDRPAAPVKPRVLGTNDVVAFVGGAGPSGHFVVESVDSAEGSAVVAGSDGSRWCCHAASLKLVREATRRATVSLVDGPVQLDDSTSPVTEQVLESLGFSIAPKEDFIGAGDKTYFLDVEAPAGISTVVYDFKPIGANLPAAHTYYRSREGGVFESAACFSAKCTVGELKSLIKTAESLNPATGEKNKRLKSVHEMVAHLQSRTRAPE